MKYYFICFVVVLALLLGSAWLVAKNARMAFMSDFDVRLTTKIEMAHSLPPNSVVILGDSAAVNDLIPTRLGRDVVNLGMEQAGPVEGFAFTQFMLSSPHPPRAVLLVYAPWHLNSIEPWFFADAISAGLYDREMLDGLLSRARILHDPLPGPESWGEIDFHLKTTLNLHRFPSFYFPSLLHVFSNDRRKTNRRLAAEIRTSLGYTSGPSRNGCQEILSLPKHFMPYSLADDYFSDMLSLLQRQNIPVYYLGPPISDISDAELAIDFRSEYTHYLQMYETKYPNFHLLGEPIPQLSWREFGDRAHLNPGGAVRFSDHVADVLGKASIEE